MTPIESTLIMHETDFWTSSGKAMELSLEGNRLLASEIGRGFRSLWKWAGRSLGTLLHEHAQHQHLPPV